MHHLPRVAVTVLGALACAGPAAAQLTLPKAMRGDSNYQNRVHSAWALVITKIGDDGRFEGEVTYNGRACNARRTPITNGTIKDEVVQFNLDMGPTCSANTFTLRKGTTHLLEGELKSNVAPEPAQVWLDPE